MTGRTSSWIRCCSFVHVFQSQNSEMQTSWNVLKMSSIVKDMGNKESIKLAQQNTGNMSSTRDADIPKPTASVRGMYRKFLMPSCSIWLHGKALLI